MELSIQPLSTIVSRLVKIASVVRQRREKRARTAIREAGYKITPCNCNGVTVARCIQASERDNG